MRIDAGPWSLGHRGGFAVVLDVAPSERAKVGDILERSDGATWTLAGVEMGSTMPRGAVILRGETPPMLGDVLTARTTAMEAHHAPV